MIRVRSRKQQKMAAKSRGTESHATSRAQNHFDPKKERANRSDCFAENEHEEIARRSDRYVFERPMSGFSIYIYLFLFIYFHWQARSP